jgi:hypothetical protein
MIDTPTNNFATLNPLDKSGTAATFKNGNLHAVNSSNAYAQAYSNFAMTSGKWYAEVCLVDPKVSSYQTEIGVITGDASGNPAADRYLGQDTGTYRAGTTLWGMARYNVGAIAVDADAGKAWYYDGTSWLSGSPSSGTSPTHSSLASPIRMAMDSANSEGLMWNFGQDSSFAGNKTAQGNQDSNGIGSFYYTPPSGFLALCSANLPDPTVIPSKHFNTVLWTGNATQRNITGVGFQPDFVWGKNRVFGNWNELNDSVRGAGKSVYSNATTAEGTASQKLQAFLSDGFQIGTAQGFNKTGDVHVAWNWKAGGTAVSNTSGSITSSVSANVDAGFSIVSYTGQSGASTVGHGLSEAPEMIMVKNRDSAQEWVVMVEHCGNADFETDYLRLDTNGNLGDNTFFNDTKPTASLFSVGDSQPTNSGHGNAYIAYCFHSVDGFSKMGFFHGNSSTDGVFTYCGFSPRYIMIKKINGNNNWYIYDTARTPYNATGTVLLADSSNAEATQTYFHIDILSNGFKARTSDGALNASSGQYTWVAFAEQPFKHSNAR